MKLKLIWKKLMELWLEDAAYHTPYLLADIERKIFNNENVPSRQEVIEQLLPYTLEKKLKKEHDLNQIMRHTLGLFHGQTGSSLLEKIFKWKYVC